MLSVTTALTVVQEWTVNDMKKIVMACTLVVAFMVGACSPVSEVIAEQKRPLKIWFENENGMYQTLHIVDENTGVNYVVVAAEEHGKTVSVAITPRLNADGTLYVSN